MFETRRAFRRLPNRWTAPITNAVAAPTPCVAKPKRRKDIESSRVRTAVEYGQSHQDVLWRRLHVLDEDVEVAIVVEDTGVDQLELPLVTTAPFVFRNDQVVRIGSLRIL